MSSAADHANGANSTNSTNSTSARWRDWRRESPVGVQKSTMPSVRESQESRPASTSALLLAEPPPEALGRRPSAVVPLPSLASSPGLRRPSAVVAVNPAQMVANQQRFMLELMQERCSALRASLSGLSGRAARAGGGSGGGDGKDPQPTRMSKKFSQRIGEDTLTAILSALYAKILVVLGFAFPVTEILSKEVPVGFYQGFYLFLYVGSIAFMGFMYAALLKERAVNTIIRMHSAFPSGSTTEKDFEAPPPLRRITPVAPVTRYGSFYLRLGAIAFGIGSMVYSGLEFGEYFEIEQNTACHNALQALNPATRIVLTLLQMQFIFLNSKDMKMWRHKVVARFGLMHTIACNLCEWLYVLVAETRHEIKHLKSQGANVTHHEEASEDCRRSHIIGHLVQDASPFLFPCTVEYSLICAVVLYEMWKNVNKPPPPSARGHSGRDDTAASTPAPSAPATRPSSSSTGDEDIENDSNDSKEEKPNNETTICPVDPHHQHFNAIYHQHHQYHHMRSHYHFSVDCAGAHKGLFVGIVVMVLTIISLILFFVLNKDPSHHKTAVLEVNVIELVLYVLCTIAVLLCMLRMRTLKYKRKQSHGHEGGNGLSMDNSLLLIAQTGVYIYCMFSIIGCYFSDESDLGLVAELFSLVQTTVQTLFVLDAWSRRCRSISQARRKPGRQIVTFLLVANMSMWSINTLEKGHASFRPTHLVFFGEWAWTIITRVSMPLAIFYRFHSTICLFEIWKNAYKFKPQYSL